MCWNESVSLNTFLFSSFVLALIIYNNSFTKYKIQELNNNWTYLFITSVIFMQLIEFFIWRNINNKYYNNIFSISAVFLLIIQPICSIMILTNANIKLRNVLLIFYLLLVIPYSIYQFSTKHISSTISKNGHLTWKYFDTSIITWTIWLFFLLISFVYEKKWFGIIFGLLILIITILNYKNDNSVGSMWCWVINSIMIYYVCYLLLFLPFLEKKKLC